jgi:hypothetical protein
VHHDADAVARLEGDGARLLNGNGYLRLEVLKVEDALGCAATAEERYNKEKGEEPGKPNGVSA